MHTERRKESRCDFSLSISNALNRSSIDGATVYAIVTDRLSALELAITPDMGHDGWASDVVLGNIHERSLITRRFHLYKNTKVCMETP